MDGRPAPAPAAASAEEQRPPTSPPETADSAEQAAEDVGEAESEPTEGPQAEALDLERLVGLWPAVIDQVRDRARSCSRTLLSVARPVAVDVEAAVLQVGFPASAGFNKRKAEARRRARPSSPRP